MIKKFRELYAYREMILSLVKKNLRSRYKASFLGFLWTFVNPLLQLAVYATIFQVVFKIQIPNYAMFLFVALLPWTAFTTAMISSLSSIVGNVNLVKKIYFPRMVLPVSTALTYIVDFIYCLPILIGSILIFGKNGVSPWILFLPMIILTQFIFTVGICLIVSSLNVKFRDLEQIVNIITLVWFYFTPVLYDTKSFPPALQKYLFFNPMTGIIESYRDILFYAKAPDFMAFTIAFVASIVMFIIGYYIFNKLSRTFAEDL